MKGSAFQIGLQGIYERHQTINGRSSWKSSLKAIWFEPLYHKWAIGDFENLGTTNREIWTYNNKWNYRGQIENGNGSISVQCLHEGNILHFTTILYLLIFI